MKRKNGISLIVLVITIIVMIVLAGAIILSLNNAGIIEKANEAVKSTDEATVKELAQMAWAEAYASGVRKVEGEDGLQEKIEESLRNNGIKPEECLLNITTSGVTAKLKKNAWIKQGFTVVKGEQILEIGDAVNYNPEVPAYTGTWKVLGADADGNLLIMSATNVKDGYILGKDTLYEAQQDWINAPSLLDKECIIYGKGKGALKARSITREDVNKVTGYQDVYNKEITYSYNGTTKPSYTTETSSGKLNYEHNNGFYYYNGKEFLLVNDLSEKSSGIITKIIGGYEFYYTPDLSTISSTNNAKAYSMLFGNNDSSYWLANNCISTNANDVSYNVYTCMEGYVLGFVLCNSQGTTSPVYNDLGVRAVVTLSSDINFTGSSETGWSY